MIVIVELDILIDIVTDCYKAFNRENRLEYNSILKSNSSIVSELYMVIVVIVDKSSFISSYRAMHLWLKCRSQKSN